MRTTPLGPFWLRLLLVVGLALGLERLIVTDAEELEDLAREAAAAAQAMREAAVAVMIPVWRDDPGQRGQRDATLGAFDALGGETDDGVRFPPGTVNFTSTVATLAGKVRMARGMGQQPLAIYVVGGSDTDALVAALRASPDLAGVLLFDSDGSRLDG